MKKTLLTLAVAMMSLFAQAQIFVTPYVDATVNGLNENSMDLVENRIRSIISSNGMISSYNSRFILGTKINLLDREFTATAPARIIQRLSVTLAIGDGVTGTCYGSTTFEVKGIGDTEESAMLSACKSVPKSNKQIHDLVATAKERIVAYYEENAANIIAKAKSLEGTQDYEAALAELAAIPQECSKYKEALELIVKISKSSIDQDAACLISEAQAVWSADPNPGPSAELAMEILSQVDPSSKHYAKAQALMQKVEARVKGVTDQRYKDAVAYENAKLKAYATLENARLKAVSEVAVAYAKNQPKVVYNVRGWW